MLIKSKFIILALCAVALVGCASQTRTEGGPPAQDPSGTGAGVPEQGAPQGEALPGARADLLAKRRVYFAFDSSSLDDENRAIVEAHAQYLAANPNVKVHLEGHCDERGTREYNARASYASDGKTLTLVSARAGRFHIATLRLDDGTLQVLTDTPLDESPSFAPNGRMILYASELRGRGVLASVSADGRVRQLFREEAGDVREPAWSPFNRELQYKE